ncbi:hypothetical protein [Microbacterium sp. VKM Ac-2923]|uniref:RCC1 domain-containing protein n=1 Tax=Microbacterium sp. VKM Ac-2923 TaxID=2929476 RepID=UPI001FB36F29|nr:hypothetical protein [Microbacterium sp. VKM Ac-2923]MCJ1706626.1 hypothetical protein [Microbacterium sp. VKM Ac-2923]
MEGVSDSGGVSRRRVLAGAAWAVPAVVLTTSTPALAAVSDTFSIALTTPNAQVPAAGSAAVTALVSNGSGAPVAGAAVSFTGPAGSSFTPATATTGADGRAMSAFDLADPWLPAGSSVSVSAVGSGTSTSAGFTVLGANAALAGTSASSWFQEDLVFPSPVRQLLASSEAPAFDQPPSWSFRVAVLEDGTVWSVGSNTYGQLGDGSTTARSEWKEIAGLSGIVQISLGRAVCYAVSQDQRVYAWGRNNVGQVGIGSVVDQLTPVMVVGLTEVISIASGGNSVLALRADGTVRSWGNGADGRLGNGDVVNQSSPVVVTGLSEVAQIACGRASAYALLRNGTMMSWGTNSSGQLGDSTSGDRSTAGAVSDLGQSVTGIAASYESAYAILADKTLRAWGAGGRGCLGNGAGSDSATPVTVSGLSDVKSIYAYYSSAFAVRSDESVFGWGYNVNGQLGIGNTSNQTTPVSVPLPNGQRVVSMSSNGCLGLKTAITVEASGGSLTLSSVPAQIPASGVATVSAALLDWKGQAVPSKSVSFTAPSGATVSPRSVATDAMGMASAVVNLRTPWAQPGSLVTLEATANGLEQSRAFTVAGSNLVATGGHYNAQGTPYQTETVFPLTVKQVTSQISFNGAPPFFLALLDDGTVWSMGGNSTGQLGIGTSEDRPGWGPIPGLNGVTQIASGYGTGLALLSDGSVKAWGWGNAGNLGNGSNVNKFSPTAVDHSLMQNVVQIAANGYGSFAVCADGSAYSWGAARALGDGTAPTSSVNRLTPVPLTDLGTDVAFITAQNVTASALMKDGSVMSWGSNINGQVGDGTNADRARPVLVPGLTSGVTAITSGALMALALRSDGTVHAWGRNDGGSLGDGTLVKRNSPVQVVGLPAAVASLGAGSGTGYAQCIDGTLWAWGAGKAGQLGNNTTADSAVPASFTLPAGREFVRFNNGSSGSNDLLVVTKPA